MKSRTRVTLTLLAGLAVGCTTRELAVTLPNEGGEIRGEIPIHQIHKLDLLFVIDNSGSMGQEQESLAKNFGEFIALLEHVPDAESPTGFSLPDIHIGVVSSNVGSGGHDLGGCAKDGDDGKLQTTPRISGCTPPRGAFISDERDAIGGRIRNYSGELADTFRCIAKLGTKGCGMEQHLEAMERALDGRNPGFLRDDAFLAVVFIADEDDCSAKSPDLFDPAGILENARGLIDFRCVQEGTECGGERISTEARSYEGCTTRRDTNLLRSPESYAEVLRSRKANPRQIVVAAIAGDPSPFAVQTNADQVPTPESVCADPTPDVCSDPDPDPAKPCREPRAEPGVRLTHFLSLFDVDRSRFRSICQKDLRDALAALAPLLIGLPGVPCLQGNLDPVLDCVVSDQTSLASGEVTSVALPRCQQTPDGALAPGQAMPCWWARMDPDRCGYAPHLELRFERDREPPANTGVVVKCRTL